MELSPPSVDGVRYRNTFAWKFEVESRCGTYIHACMHTVLRELPFSTLSIAQRSEKLRSQQIFWASEQNQYKLPTDQIYKNQHPPCKHDSSTSTTSSLTVPRNYHSRHHLIHNSTQSSISDP